MKSAFPERGEGREYMVANFFSILYENGIKSKKSGNEVDYTACTSLIILKNSCSKIHYQEVLISFPFHIRSVIALHIGQSVLEG